MSTPSTLAGPPKCPICGQSALHCGGTKFTRNIAAFGTVSAGDMRPDHLLPAFLGELRSLDSHRATAIEAELATCDPDGADDVLASLYDILTEYAPEGATFGAHPGDGADFGFWPAEVDE